MPRASPLTIVTPRAAKSAASDSATSTPYGVGRREPTMAIASASSGSSEPRTWSAGGEGMTPSIAGYRSSLGVRKVEWGGLIANVRALSIPPRQARSRIQTDTPARDRPSFECRLCRRNRGEGFGGGPRCPLRFIVAGRTGARRAGCAPLARTDKAESTDEVETAQEDHVDHAAGGDGRVAW